MPIYILKDKTYEIFPKLSQDNSDDNPSQRQLMKLATTLSEHFGCFMIFGMSYNGEPRMMLSGSSGMEHLALKKFAEDIILGEGGAAVVPLDQEDEQ